MKIDHAIETVQEAEADLAAELQKVGERHALESDLFHLGHTLSRIAEQKLARLSPLAERYGASPRSDVPRPSGVLERVRRLSSEALGREEQSGLLLLHDLRRLYVAAHEAEVAWVVLLQGAKAARDAELVAAAEDGRAHAETRWKWLLTRVKETAPQVLVAG